MDFVFEIAAVIFAAIAAYPAAMQAAGDLKKK
jgi:hypothetical protein